MRHAFTASLDLPSAPRFYASVYRYSYDQDYSPNGSEAITFTGGQNGHSLNKPRSDTFSLLLRTQRVIPSISVLSESRSNPDLIYVTCAGVAKTQQEHLYGLYEINIKHDQEPILRYSSSEVLYALASGPQTLLLRPFTYSEQLPDWLVLLLSKSKTVSDWLDRDREEMIIYDHHAQRTIWKDRYDREASPGGRLDEHWFCTHKTDSNRNQMQIEVYRLPFPSWSPWLARLSGFFIAVLAWWMIGRFARTRVKAV